ncbi:unnamed protein product [Amoebophrya sp. A25]|nr:unnamed protein product [Amoebophrya sp. A25]|eukprot:GSA25T00012011001.1
MLGVLCVVESATEPARILFRYPPDKNSFGNISDGSLARMLLPRERKLLNERLEFILDYADHKTSFSTKPPARLRVSSFPRDARVVLVDRPPTRTARKSARMSSQGILDSETSKPACAPGPVSTTTSALLKVPLPDTNLETTRSPFGSGDAGRGFRPASGEGGVDYPPCSQDRGAEKNDEFFSTHAVVEDYPSKLSMRTDGLDEMGIINDKDSALVQQQSGLNTPFGELLCFNIVLVTRSEYTGVLNTENLWKICRRCSDLFQTYPILFQQTGLLERVYWCLQRYPGGNTSIAIFDDPSAVVPPQVLGDPSAAPVDNKDKDTSDKDEGTRSTEWAQEHQQVEGQGVPPAPLSPTGSSVSGVTFSIPGSSEATGQRQLSSSSSSSSQKPSSLPETLSMIEFVGAPFSEDIILHRPSYLDVRYAELMEEEKKDSLIQHEQNRQDKIDKNSRSQLGGSYMGASTSSSALWDEHDDDAAKYSQEEQEKSAFLLDYPPRRGFGFGPQALSPVTAGNTGGGGGGGDGRRDGGGGVGGSRTNTTSPSRDERTFDHVAATCSVPLADFYVNNVVFTQVVTEQTERAFAETFHGLVILDIIAALSCADAYAWFEMIDAVASQEPVAEEQIPPGSTKKEEQRSLLSRRILGWLYRRKIICCYRNGAVYSPCGGADVGENVPELLLEKFGHSLSDGELAYLYEKVADLDVDAALGYAETIERVKRNPFAAFDAKGPLIDAGLLIPFSSETPWRESYEDPLP